jgi:hypothetical protein
MSEFEFISVLVSIVVAFGMAELIIGWGRLIRARANISKPFFFIGWSVWLLLLMVFHYLGIWEYQAVDFHSVGQLVLLLSPPIVLVLLTFVLTPEARGARDLDLEAHYFDVRYWFFALVGVFLSLSLVADMLLPNFAEFWMARMVQAVIIAVSIGLAVFIKMRSVQVTILLFNLFFLTLGSIVQDVPSL